MGVLPGGSVPPQVVPPSWIFFDSRDSEVVAALREAVGWMPWALFPALDGLGLVSYPLGALFYGKKSGQLRARNQAV